MTLEFSARGHSLCTKPRKSILMFFVFRSRSPSFSRSRMERPVRVRVVFEDRCLLTKSQRSEGLRQCWLLLRPECATIADLADHVASRFSLRVTSSDDLLFLMDEFVLPSFELTCIFKDKDIIRVRKKVDQKKFIKLYDVHDSVIVEKQPILHNVELLAIKEFQKDVREHKSKNEDDQYENQDNPICQQRLLSEGTDTKGKRKSSDKLQGSKSKKLNALILHRTDVGSKETSNPATTVVRNEQVEQNCHINTCKAHVCGVAKKLPSRSARRKKVKRQLRREKASHQLRKNLQGHVLANELLCTSSKYHSENHDTEREEIVPIIVQSGHIHFEPPEQSNLQPNGPVKTYQWNGTTSMKRQKWGQEKTMCRRNDGNGFHVSTNEKLVVGEGKIIYKLLDFESLFPLTRLPKEGDVIVYRMVELSSRCPELSPIRVGKVSSYNCISMKIILIPVPEYPIFPPGKRDAEGLEMQPGVSFYKQDGSLEIDYPSLVDVRLLKESESESTIVTSHSRQLTKDAAPVNNRKAALGKHIAKIDDWEVAVAKSSAKDSAISPAGSRPSTGWDQIGQTVNEETQLQSNGWGSWIPNKSSTTTTSTLCSYRVPRGTVLGPNIRRKNGKSFAAKCYNPKFSK
ncbi:coilin-like isoform X1 [Typha latifolia]|uniref:coilin-like isoform X1 n=1 Tax=Typha latifolia TaxID=4733 RepID=UPI003C2D2C6E